MVLGLKLVYLHLICIETVMLFASGKMASRVIWYLKKIECSNIALTSAGIWCISAKKLDL